MSEIVTLAAKSNVFKDGGDFYIIHADGERLRFCEIIEQWSQIQQPNLRTLDYNETKRDMENCRSALIYMEEKV